MQWEVVLTGIWFLLGALRRACDFVIESVEARLNESFDAESRLPEGETEEFVDAMGDSPGEFKTEAVASQVLYPEHESCSTDFLNTHKSGTGKYMRLDKDIAQECI